MTHHFADRLIKKAKELNARLIVGLDPNMERLPLGLTAGLNRSREELTRALVEFNRAVINGVAQQAVAFKPQAAFYEQYGLAGLKALEQTLIYLRAQGHIIVMDAKRNDVSHTAEAYARAWLGERRPWLEEPNVWRAEALTINGYLGRDGVRPFLEADPDCGLFVLGRTTNPSTWELQDLLLNQDNVNVAERMAHLVEEWGALSVGASGYSRVGLVVGATWPETVERLRRLAPHALFLMPGVGAQGGSLESIRLGAGADGWGAFAASSRSVMFPFEPQDLDGPDWAEGVSRRCEAAARALNQQIQTEFSKG